MAVVPEKFVSRVSLSVEDPPQSSQAVTSVSSAEGRTVRPCMPMPIRTAAFPSGPGAVPDSGPIIRQAGRSSSRAAAA